MRFFRRATTFQVVTTDTGSYDVSPVLLPSLGDRNNMIEGKFFRFKASPAILTRILISGKDVASGKFHHPLLASDFNHLQESQHGRKLEGDRDASDLTIIDLQNLDFTLEEKQDRLLPRNNPQRLVGRVEKQGQLHVSIHDDSDGNGLLPKPTGKLKPRDCSSLFKVDTELRTNGLEKEVMKEKTRFEQKESL
jgi:hypothetical protein